MKPGHNCKTYWKLQLRILSRGHRKSHLQMFMYNSGINFTFISGGVYLLRNRKSYWII